jgi:hypothetical protein
VERLTADGVAPVVAVDAEQAPSAIAPTATAR